MKMRTRTSHDENRGYTIYLADRERMRSGDLKEEGRMPCPEAQSKS